jgi:catechol 2,3-dioxygenase-like lactoylglutathione lyase family enzyme
MRTHFGHVQFNVRPENLPFYKDLFGFLGWQMLYEGPGMLGVGDSGKGSLWFASEGLKDAANDYDGPGMNHIGIGTETQADVDAAAAYIAERGVPALFETPRHRPEFAGGDGQTYYQVMFETPDRILVEVVYTGARA